MHLNRATAYIVMQRMVRTKRCDLRQFRLVRVSQSLALAVAQDCYGGPQHS